jgi:hypothetical protein
MCQRSHNGVPAVSGFQKLLTQSSLWLSDSRDAVRRRGREWNRRVLLTAQKVTTMQYFALLLGEPTTPLEPEEQAAGMAAYQAFHAKAGAAIRAGDALTPSATGVRISGGPDAPT